MELCLKDKLIIPLELTAHKDRPIGSSYDVFHNKFTIVSFVPQKNKAVALISSMHQTGLIDEEKNKPEIVCFYNKTKCGVDLMDMKCATYASNRRTQKVATSLLLQNFKCM